MEYNSETDENRDHGPQPLGPLLDELGISNHELVSASTAQLTHKQVQKARKGRRLTANVQNKIKSALEAELARRGQPRIFKFSELFTYRG